MSIDKLLKEKCTGCSACYNGCPKGLISMEMDKEGFQYPIVDSRKCIGCKLCEKICPVMNINRDINKAPELFVAYNINEDIRLESSSGGIFTLIAEAIIKRGGCVFGAKFDQNFMVRHSYVETKEDLGMFRGSKYVQSNIGDTYKTVKAFLEQGKWVLFTGTTCQIAGLKGYLRKSYDNLVCVDFICRGVSSPKIWEKYLGMKEDEYNSKIRKVEFKNKEFSWKRFHMKITFEDGNIYFKSLLEDSYHRAFFTSKILRKCCYDCYYKGIYRNTDITLADCWGADILYPELFDDKGLSYIMVNSELGQELFDEIKSELVYKKTVIDNLTFCSTNSIKSVDCPEDRDEVFKLLDCNFSDLAEKYFYNDNVKMVCRNDPFSFEPEKIVNSKIICAFGAGKTFENYISNSQYQIKYVCDNDHKKWGKNICGLSCISPDDLVKFKDLFVIITVNYYDVAQAMHKQLSELNIPHKLFLQ